MNISELSKADRIARGASSCIKGVVPEIKDGLGITDEELSYFKPTVITSVGVNDDIGLGLALISVMSQIRGKNVSLFFHADGKIEVAVSR